MRFNAAESSAPLTFVAEFSRPTGFNSSRRDLWIFVASVVEARGVSGLLYPILLDREKV